MPRPPGRTRERMLDVAEALFQRHGYEGVAVEDVTSALGVKKPNLYNHFRDKSDLYVAVRLRQIRRLGADLERVLSPEMPAGEQVMGVVMVLLRHPFFLAAVAQRETETFLPEETRDVLFARSYGTVYEPITSWLGSARIVGDAALPESAVPLAYESLVALATHFAALEGVADAPERIPALALTVADLWRGGVASLAERTATESTPTTD